MQKTIYDIEDTGVQGVIEVQMRITKYKVNKIELDGNWLIINTESKGLVEVITVNLSKIVATRLCKYKSQGVEKTSILFDLTSTDTLMSIEHVSYQTMRLLQKKIIKG